MLEKIADVLDKLDLTPNERAVIFEAWDLAPEGKSIAIRDLPEYVGSPAKMSWKKARKLVLVDDISMFQASGWRLNITKSEIMNALYYAASRV